MIYKTEAITFPRSGHHLLKNILEYYFDGQLHYCSLYSDPPEVQLGVSLLTNFQKNHDFDLATPVSADRKYIVQIRDPIDAIESWFHMARRTTELCGVGVPEHSQWKEFCSGKMGYYVQFVDKWIFNHVSNRLIISYSDLLHRPENAITSVIQHMCGTADISSKRLVEALEKFPPKQQLTRTIFYERA